MENIYRIAGKSIRINSIYNDVHEMCRDYLSDGNDYDFSVCSSENDIYEEKKRAEITDLKEIGKVKDYSDGYLEELVIYRKISEVMPDYDTFLFHSSCLSADGEGYAFTAKSGTGKSTHARLWREILGNRVIMVNDDKPLVRIENGLAIAYGTPYDGKHHLSNNISVPLKAVSIIQRSKVNHIEKMSKQAAFLKLFPQIYHPVDKGRLQKTMELLGRLLECVDVYTLYCNMEVEAAEIAWQVMKGNDYETE